MKMACSKFFSASTWLVQTLKDHRRVHLLENITIQHLSLSIFHIMHENIPENLVQNTSENVSNCSKISYHSLLCHYPGGPTLIVRFSQYDFQKGVNKVITHTRRQKSISFQNFHSTTFNIK